MRSHRAMQLLLALSQVALFACDKPPFAMVTLPSIPQSLAMTHCRCSWCACLPATSAAQSYLGLTSRKSYSSKCMVTPQVPRLHSPARRMNQPAVHV
jgi:hypothetical protein